MASLDTLGHYLKQNKKPKPETCSLIGDRAIGTASLEGWTQNQSQPWRGNASGTVATHVRKCQYHIQLGIVSDTKKNPGAGLTQAPHQETGLPSVQKCYLGNRPGRVRSSNVPTE